MGDRDVAWVSFDRVKTVAQAKRVRWLGERFARLAG